MDSKAMLLLLLACGICPEGSSGQLPIMNGVNSRKGSKREPRPFHCTNAVTDSTATTQLTPRKPTSEQQTPTLLTSSPATSPPCSPNMVLGPSCDCERTCQNPISCNCTGPETACVCQDNFLMNNGQCVPENECECYYDGGQIVIPDGTTYVKDDCSERCTCDNNQLSCDSTYTCSPHAECKVKYNVRQCYCNDGYVGDGETCKQYTDCYDAYQAGHRENGVFTILPSSWPSDSPFKAYCDMETDGGGWTVFQRRIDGVTNFTRNWEDYKSGFGSFNESSDFWLGNEKLHYLTQQKDYKLRVDRITTNEGWKLMTEYDSFKIGTEEENYKLSDLGHSGKSDGMRSVEGMNFSTHDQDNIGCNQFSCVEVYGGGGWWYSDKVFYECLSSSAVNGCPTSVCIQLRQ